MRVWPCCGLRTAPCAGGSSWSLGVHAGARRGVGASAVSPSTGWGKVTPEGPLRCWVLGLILHVASPCMASHQSPCPVRCEIASCIWPLELPVDHPKATEENALFSSQGVVAAFLFV